MLAPVLRALPGILPLLLFLFAQAAAAQSRPLQGLDEFIQRGMDAWEIPGLAIAVVKNDSVVYARGFGVRELGKPEPIDPNTLFAIGSASKAFTAAAVGILVDDGKVKWDDPATKYLPGFRVFDPYVTRELTVRDLLTHRSGLLRGDALWYATDLDREQILERARHQEPTSSFRSLFGYNNIMYLAAGQIIPAVAGTSWDDFVKERIFTPLGMSRSTTSVDPLSGMDNVATPHEEIDGRVRPIRHRDIDNIAPAGSVVSSVAETARWIRMQLAHGDFQGRELLKEETVREMHTPQTIVRLEDGWKLMAPESHFLAYGMGWFLNDYRGRKVVQHGGNIDGMHALVGMLPEEDLGVVVLTNRNPNYLTYATMYHVFDGYLGGPREEWIDRLKVAFDSLRAEGEAARRKMEEARVSGTRPSLESGKYAGTYRDAMYGEAIVAQEGSRLVLRRGQGLVGDLEHWHYDTFRVNWRDPSIARGFVTFFLDARGRVSELEIQGLAGFERVPEPAAEVTRE